MEFVRTNLAFKSFKNI